MGAPMGNKNAAGSRGGSKKTKSSKIKLPPHLRKLANSKKFQKGFKKAQKQIGKKLMKGTNRYK